MNIRDMIGEKNVQVGRWWTRAWSLVDGCTKVSPACDHCWLETQHKRFHPDRPFSDVRFWEDMLTVPLRRKKPTVYAVWSDLFHPAITTRQIGSALDVMSACPQHIFLVLTKRAHLIEKKLYEVTAENGCRELGGGDYLPNLWLGVTVENQEQVDKRIPLLLQTPAAVRFISVEPMLGDIFLPPSALSGGIKAGIASNGAYYPGITRQRIDWVICGGETGHGARPMHPDWARSLRDQCTAAGVPFWFKGWGAKLPDGQCCSDMLDEKIYHKLPEVRG